MVGRIGFSLFFHDRGSPLPLHPSTPPALVWPWYIKVSCVVYVQSISLFPLRPLSHLLLSMTTRTPIRTATTAPICGLSCTSLKICAGSAPPPAPPHRSPANSAMWVASISGPACPLPPLAPNVYQAPMVPRRVSPAAPLAHLVHTRALPERSHSPIVQAATSCIARPAGKYGTVGGSLLSPTVRIAPWVPSIPTREPLLKPHVVLVIRALTAPAMV